MKSADFIWIHFVYGGMLCADVVLLLYVSYFKLYEIEQCLKNCQVVALNKKIWGGIGPVDRTNRLLQISMILDSTKLWHDTDNVDMDEVRSFPVVLKRWVLYPYYLSYMLLMVSIPYLAWEKWYLPA